MGIRRWYIPLVMFLVWAFAPVLSELKRGEQLDKQATLSVAPTYSVEKIREEFSWVKTVENEWNGRATEVTLPDNASAYWDYLTRRQMLEDAMIKFLAVNSPFDQPGREVEARQKSLATASPVAIVNYNFGTKFGIDEMVKARPAKLYSDTRRPSVKTNAGTEFIIGYLWSIPAMFLVFIIRLRVRGLMVMPELGRMSLYSIIWPIGLIVYPKDVRREEQIKQWMFSTAQLASAVMSLFGFMPMVPVMKAQTLDGKNKTEKSEKKSVEKFSFGGLHGGFEYYPDALTSGPDKGNMFSPWYSFSETIGEFKLSHNGFVEMGDRKSQLFSNNGSSLTWQKAPWLEYRMETGFTATSGFLASGPRVMFSKIPRFGKMLSKSGVSCLGLGRYSRVRGPGQVDEYVAYWGLKPMKIGKVGDVIIDGFYRIRPGATKNVGEPQLSFRPKKFGGKVMFTFEAWVVGDTVTPRFGLQFSR